MKERDKRVLVGMSGGIDSTATCLMLQEQGYEIVGVTMRVWGDEPQDARELAARMGIEHYVADERIPFKETIVKNFIDEYKQGRTPNPCVMCNPLFKFRVLAEWADKLDCAYIATGHYSRLEERSGHIYIVAGDDDKKDQSYFLWRLGQDILKRCIFPLGDYTKIKVREYLAEKGYEAKSKEGESMEVCFIQGDYRDFLREQCPELDMAIILLTLLESGTQSLLIHLTLTLSIRVITRRLSRRRTLQRISLRYFILMITIMQVRN